MAASKLAALQEEYEEKFEDQLLGPLVTDSHGHAHKKLVYSSLDHQPLDRSFGRPVDSTRLRNLQLQAALLNKERIEREKQEAVKRGERTRAGDWSGQKGDVWSV